jgi:hypothetical protein
MVPGAGHIFLRRSGKGLLLCFAIVTLFVLGVVMDARLQVSTGFDDPLAFLFSLAQIAAGLPYLIARGLGYETGIVEAATFEYGNTYTAVAGLLNILAIFDAFDIGLGRKK